MKGGILLLKKIKIIIFLFIIFNLTFFFQSAFAKYVLEDTKVIATLHIDRCKPKIELVDVFSSNIDYPNYADQTHLITAHIKLTEKNIVKNNLCTDNIKVYIEDNCIMPIFKSFSLISENDYEKIYEISFTNIISDGNLSFVISEGIVEDISRANK